MGLESEQADRERSQSPERSLPLYVGAKGSTTYPSPRHLLPHASMADLVASFSRPPSVTSLFSPGSSLPATHVPTGRNSNKPCVIDILAFRRYLLRKFGSVDSAFTD